MTSTIPSIETTHLSTFVRLEYCARAQKSSELQLHPNPLFVNFLKLALTFLGLHPVTHTRYHMLNFFRPSKVKLLQKKYRKITKEIHYFEKLDPQESERKTLEACEIQRQIVQLAAS